jgi:hypothetical protein
MFCSAGGSIGPAAGFEAAVWVDPEGFRGHALCDLFHERYDWLFYLRVSSRAAKGAYAMAAAVSRLAVPVAVSRN